MIHIVKLLWLQELSIKNINSNISQKRGALNASYIATMSQSHTGVWWDHCFKDITESSWQQMVSKRESWRALKKVAGHTFETQKKDIKNRLRIWKNLNRPLVNNGFVCSTCGKICRSQWFWMIRWNTALILNLFFGIEDITLLLILTLKTSLLILFRKTYCTMSSCNFLQMYMTASSNLSLLIFTKCCLIVTAYKYYKTFIMRCVRIVWCSIYIMECVCM